MSRSITLSIRQLVRMARADVPDVHDATEPSGRPILRSHCAEGPRPCPWVSCRYHLAIDVTQDGGLRLNFGHDDVASMERTCSLDESDSGPLRHEEVGERLNLTGERVRQIEVDAFDQVSRAMRRLRRREGLEAAEMTLEPGVTP